MLVDNRIDNLTNMRNSSTVYIANETVSQLNVSTWEISRITQSRLKEWIREAIIKVYHYYSLCIELFIFTNITFYINTFVEMLTVLNWKGVKRLDFKNGPSTVKTTKNYVWVTKKCRCVVFVHRSTSKFCKDIQSRWMTEPEFLGTWKWT